MLRIVRIVDCVSSIISKDLIFEIISQSRISRIFHSPRILSRLINGSYSRARGAAFREISLAYIRERPNQFRYAAAEIKSPIFPEAP